jgi:hypothetical protein
MYFKHENQLINLQIIKTVPMYENQLHMTAAKIEEVYFNFFQKLSSNLSMKIYKLTRTFFN